MSKKRQRQKKLRGSIWLVGGALVLVVISFGIWFFYANSARSAVSTASALDVAANLASTDTAFNVRTRVGQPAPAFTLSDANGQPYKFQPSDGRKYVLAFNMGYV